MVCEYKLINILLAKWKVEAGVLNSQGRL